MISLGVLTLFAVRPDADEKAIDRFVKNIRFDRNLVGLILGFVACPRLTKLAPCHIEVTGANSLAIHPQTGHLWLANADHKLLTVRSTTTPSLDPIQTIRCRGEPWCVRISDSGRVMVLERRPGAV